ncbi:PREDICTED: uncharacterized protein At3g43530-like [Brassica oleracea var. oleracea]|uniref:uncharacterized protein At3g43530-like n=1 Tax=Brassica oleracea var. oleracea TaxID=109376 RepID=UPI0006A6AF12|nr:PREDICTED: uncharacterized protein At3g43530-like [Brassica oleracea var. oleracea]
MKRKERNREHIGSNNSDSNPPEAAIGSATIDNDAPRTAGEENMAVEPMRPVGFFFKPSDYWTACKLSSRCHQHDFLETIKDFKESEKSWFENHPQFKHLFHMDCCEKRKVQGLWMLLLRCMHTGKERQAWFGVNGVPIRYSIREHALLSGLYCGSYPENYPRKGKMKFATKHFKHLQKKTKEKNRKKQGLRVTEADVLEKLEKMEADDGSDERLKMAVLYFLTRVIRGRTRNAYFIEPFILQAVDDLDFCNKFPWGRYTFDDCMKEIFHLRDHFAKGLPENNMQWTFPGFVIPLEILAFECIPVLRESFRDPDPNCLPDCPRMCKWKYKRTGTTGFALEEIYKALGNTKVISSTLKPQGDELDLLYEIMDEGSVEDVELQDDSDKADIAVDGWNRILIKPEGKISWEDLFEMDVRTRPTTQQLSEPHARVKEFEQDKIQRENRSFQFGEYETCEASGGKGRDNMGNGNEDGEAVAEKDGEKQVEEEAEKNGTKEAEKDGAKEAEKDGAKVAEKDGAKEAEKDGAKVAEKDGAKEAEKDGAKVAEKDGAKEAEKDGAKVAEKDGAKEAEKDGAKVAEKDGAKEAGTTPEDAEGEEEAAKEAYEVAGNEDEVGQKEGETEADKEGETEEGKTDVEDSPSTLQVMAEAAEKLEKEVDDKAAAEKAGDELAAAEKAASDKEKVGDEEETRPKRTHKPSRPLRSPYQKN